MILLGLKMLCCTIFCVFWNALHEISRGIESQLALNANAKFVYIWSLDRCKRFNANIKGVQGPEGRGCYWIMLQACICSKVYIHTVCDIRTYGQTDQVTEFLEINLQSVINILVAL